VWIDEKPVLALPDTGAPLAGAWGLGASRDRVARGATWFFKALP
jgi:hypothetical protein